MNHPANSQLLHKRVSARGGIRRRAGLRMALKVMVMEPMKMRVRVEVEVEVKVKAKVKVVTVMYACIVIRRLSTLHRPPRLMLRHRLMLRQVIVTVVKATAVAVAMAVVAMGGGNVAVHGVVGRVWKRKQRW